LEPFLHAVRLLGGGVTMRSYYVELTCQASQTAAVLEEHLDEVMDALLDEPGIEDADVGADLGTGVVDFCIHLDAEDSPDALRKVHVLVRSALHAAGGGTPGWERLIEAIENDETATTVRPSELVDC
jgi:hypothetical protein